MIDAPISDLISKDLRRWFKEKWVDVSRKDKDGKHPPCGRGEAKTDSKGYPKCRPSKKVSEDTPKTSRSMSRKEKKAATRRKRSKPQGVGGKPTMVKSIFDNISPEQARAIAFSMNSPFDYMEQGEVEIPEVKTEETGRDPCCQEAYNAMQNIKSKTDGHPLFAHIEGGVQRQADRLHDGDFCAYVRSYLEQKENQAISWLSGTKPSHQRMRRDWDPMAEKITLQDFDEYMEEIAEEARKILDNWDACSAAKLPDDGMFTASANPFEAAWDSITKGRFHGYTQSNISNRPYRQAEHRVWDISRKVKRERTKRRYARNKGRGIIRPAMRRQLGAGGKRASTKR